MTDTPMDVAQRFPTLRIAILGDVMLDGYTSGTTRRLCQEAPVPVVDLVDHCDMPGGAANVAMNVQALGAKTTLISVLGFDEAGQRLLEQLGAVRIETAGAVRTDDRRTLSKRRILSDGQLIARLDEGTTSPLTSDLEDALIARLQQAMSQCDALIISDYRYGILTPRVIAALEEIRRTMPDKIVVADSKDLRLYRHVRPTAVKPNSAQTQGLLGCQFETNPGARWRCLLNEGRQLRETTGADIIAATLDSEGALIFSGDDTPYRTYTRPSPQCQAAGAGDTFLSGFALALAAGATPDVAGNIAAAAASVVVHQPHTSVCTLDALLQSLQGQSSLDKHRALAQVLSEYRRQGRRIVLTNGCFDILHPGHIAYLEQAKALGDVLIVGVNADESIRRLKGPERPINTVDDRLRVLAALSCVDHLIAFSEDTPHRLIEMIRPDVFVKGGDYSRETLPEASLVEELGGSIKILPFMEGRSTTRIISRIHAMNGDADVTSRTGHVSGARS